MKYRPEIDGLRAIAVIPVILFHAGIEWLSGGFIGVDVFFVISGYLITTILITDIENKKFSLINFYNRRILRIMPALLIVLSITYLISWLLLLPSSHKVVGQYVVSSILSFSNILLYIKGKDYFGLETGANPLFHTWSLGVEEQFYFFFPLILFGAWRFGKLKTSFLLGTVLLISFITSELLWRNNPYANFYLLPTRAWELLIGSFASFFVKKYGVRRSSVLSIVGIILIAFSVIYFDHNTPFPSAYSLLPVLGALLVILYTHPETLGFKLLANRVFVSIGLISYSLYLWHVPIQIYFTYIFSENNLYFAISYIVLFVIALLSYRLIELPFRKVQNIKVAYLFVCSFSALLLGLGTLGHFNGGFPERSEAISMLQTNNGFGLACNGNTVISNNCASSLTPEVAVLGNSYAMQWVNSMSAGPTNAFVQLTIDSCPLGFVHKAHNFNRTQCQDFYEKALSTIKNTETIKTVILSSPFDKELSNETYFSALTNLLDELQSVKVFIIGPTPRAPFAVGECVIRSRVFKTHENCNFQLDGNVATKMVLLSDMVSNYENVTFIDLTDVICPDGHCVMMLGSNNPLYIDKGHLTLRGAEHIYRTLGLDDEIFSFLNN